MKIPSAPANTFDPQCGCDGVTYWNADIAAAHGANVASAGACGTSAVKCSAEKTCPTGTQCNFDQGAQSKCLNAAVNPQGVCWATPTTCTDGLGGRGKRCSGGGPNAGCTSYCASIQAGQAFYPVASCL